MVDGRCLKSEICSRFLAVRLFTDKVVISNALITDSCVVCSPVKVLFPQFVLRVSQNFRFSSFCINLVLVTKS